MHCPACVSEIAARLSLFLSIVCKKARRNAQICLKAAHYTAVLSRFPEANC